eukprot:TRINITY_DN18622_c0_g1_i1.p1 TRINITY_DN18622_c0_g1~~TRINITY_DN18622_c0_g1_i1.p1  ORF type:complete len:137 (-),score=11.10 TRINITY_DN18622_c0_g1_i1:116-526(-)
MVKKKSKEVEEEIINIAVKVILLVKHKNLSRADIIPLKEKITELCNYFIHCIKFVFDYIPGPEEKTHILATALVEESIKLFQKHLSPKNLLKYTELCNYITSTRTLDLLLLEPQLKPSRDDWSFIMSKVLAIMDVL